MNKEYLKAQMNHRLGLANWWMHAASNGHAGTRRMFKQDQQLDQEALRDDAMKTSMRHLNMYMELAEELYKLERELNDKI